jgi:hypothetical protein
MSLLLSSCTKLDLGDDASISTKKARLCNDWLLFQITDASGNPIDSTGYSENLILKRDGTFEKTASLFQNNISTNLSSISGLWRFAFEKESLVLMNVTRNINIEYDIVKLSTTELIIRDEKTRVSYHYLPNEK